MTCRRKERLELQEHTSWVSFLEPRTMAVHVSHASMVHGAALTPGRLDERCRAARTGGRLKALVVIMTSHNSFETYRGIEPAAFDNVLDIILTGWTMYMLQTGLRLVTLLGGGLSNFFNRPNLVPLSEISAC